MKRWLLAAVLASGAVLAACGSSSPSPFPGDTADGGADGAQATGKDAGGSAEGGASDASLPEGGSAEAAGPSYATPYFPLAVGLSWTWPACTTGGSPVTTTISSDTGGVYTMTNPPGCYFGTLQYQVAAQASGDTYVYVIEPSGGGTYLEFDFPPAQGKTWAAGGASGAVYTWDQHFDTYTVPAGTFSDCWHMTVSGQTAVLCRDVGEVSFDSTNLAGKSF
ncbi:MAG TPA: hypothetical protein VIF09_08875 [Polyangiaceae bacterium]